MTEGGSKVHAEGFDSEGIAISIGHFLVFDKIIVHFDGGEAPPADAHRSEG